MGSKTFLFVLCARGGGACAEPVPAPALPPVAVRSCGPLEMEPTASEPRVLVLETAIRARERDLRCGPPSRQRRVCRTLWLAERLDPVPAMAGGVTPGPDEFDILIWVLNDGAEASTGELSRAFVELSALTVNLSTARSDSELASIVVRRASASIVEPIRRAEATC